MDKAIRNAVDWYNFAEQRLGRIISHDSLYLITGFYKARSWSLAAYRRAPAQVKPQLSSKLCKSAEVTSRRVIPGRPRMPWIGA